MNSESCSIRHSTRENKGFSNNCPLLLCNLWDLMYYSPFFVCKLKTFCFKTSFFTRATISMSLHTFSWKRHKTMTQFLKPRNGTVCICNFCHTANRRLAQQEGQEVTQFVIAFLLQPTSTWVTQQKRSRKWHRLYLPLIVTRPGREWFKKEGREVKQSCAHSTNQPRDTQAKRKLEVPPCLGADLVVRPALRVEKTVHNVSGLKEQNNASKQK